MEGQTTYADGIKRMIEITYMSLTVTVCVASFSDEIQCRLSAWAKEQGIRTGLLSRLPWEADLTATDVELEVEKDVLNDSIQARPAFFYNLAS